MLAIAGFHVPAIPFVEVVGNAGTVPPAQIVKLAPKPNTGVIFGLTVTVSVVVVAQMPAAGVNVYDAEFWLSIVEGLHVPAIPFVDDVGRAGTLVPAQIVKLVPKLNVGVMFGLTVTLNVVVVAHWPASGVKIYDPEFWLSTTEGLHVPVIPFVDVAGNEGTVPPAHIVKLVPKPNVGGMLGLTVTVKVVVVAHKPAVGVKVYTPEFRLLATEGFQLPVTPLVDVVGNDGTVPFAHITRLVPKVKTGVTIGLTVTLKVVGVAHCPALGVNV